MKVIAFAASTSRQSINKQLVRYAADLLSKLGSIELDLLDLNDYELPLFSVDREDELGQPALAQAFLDRISASDALVISFAEHNGSYSAAYKNLYDWVSRIQPRVYRDKRMLLLSTSPGGRGGRTVMELALSQVPRFGGDIRGSVSVPSFQDNFDDERGIVSNPEIDAEIRAAVEALMADD